MTHEIRGVRVERCAFLCQQTSPNRWFGNIEMTSNCDVTNSAHQIQMTTIWPWPWLVHLRRFVAMLLLRRKGQFAPEFRNLSLQAKKRI